MASRERHSGTGRSLRPVPLFLAIGLALIGLFSGACASSAPTAGPKASIGMAFVPAFEALEAAVWAQEDVLARRILAGIRARGMGAAEESLALKFERILDGRAILAGISLSLAVEPVAEADERRLLTLVAHNHHSTAIVLDLPPASLRRKSMVLGVAFTERGLETHDAQHLETDHLNALQGFAIDGNAESRLELLEFELSADGALAVRDHWSLELRSGEVRMDGELFPAQNPRVEGVDAVALARWLPTDALEPTELVRYALQPSVTTGGLIERAVRIPSEQRGAAIAGLRAVETQIDDSRFAELVPALRWLSGSVLPGTDPRAWRRWLRRTEETPSNSPDDRVPDRGLELPTR